MSLDAQTVTLLVAVPAGVTALAGAVGKWAETRGEKSRDRIEEEKRRAEEGSKDHDRLRQERDEAWDDVGECQKKLGECQDLRIAETLRYGTTLREWQDARHELRAILRAALTMAKDAGCDTTALDLRVRSLENAGKPEKT